MYLVPPILEPSSTKRSRISLSHNNDEEDSNMSLEEDHSDDDRTKRTKKRECTDKMMIEYRIK